MRRLGLFGRDATGGILLGEDVVWCFGHGGDRACNLAEVRGRQAYDVFFSSCETTSRNCDWDRPRPIGSPKHGSFPVYCRKLIEISKISRRITIT